MPFRLHAERSFEFSRNQMHDAEEVALELINDLTSLRKILETTVGDSSSLATHKEKQIKEACEKAFHKEEVAKARLSQMNEDLSFHCRSMEIFSYFHQNLYKMWDSMPFEIQENILKRLRVISLLNFRSVSNACKSLIDSSAFIAGYQHTELQQHILVRYGCEHNYVSVADDDTFPHQKVSLTVPMSVKLLNEPEIVGCSQGLFCFYDYFAKSSDSGKKTAVIWNPTIRKSVSIDVPNVIDEIRYAHIVSFGVCPQTLDPTLVNISIESDPGANDTFTDTTWRVEIFRLSSGVWKSLAINLPRRTVELNERYAQVIDRFIYWLALDTISPCNLVISFDMISEVFTEIHLPDNLALDPYKLYGHWYLLKFNGSLVVIEDIMDVDVPEYDVWMMDNGEPKSFIKLYTIIGHIPAKAIIGDVFGFRKSGEVFIEVDSLEEEEDAQLSVYDPKSEHIDYTGISAKESSFFVSAYTETLLLLDH